MNLQDFQDAASACSLHVFPVNSDATTLEGNSPGVFKAATQMWPANNQLNLLLCDKKKPKTKSAFVSWWTAVLKRLNEVL